METFSALLALCAGNSPVPVNSPHKSQWRGALMFSLIYAWINDWINNREAGDLRRQCGHYDVSVMKRDWKLVNGIHRWPMDYHHKASNSESVALPLRHHGKYRYIGLICQWISAKCGLSPFLIHCRCHSFVLNHRYTGKSVSSPRNNSAFFPAFGCSTPWWYTGRGWAGWAEPYRLPSGPNTAVGCWKEPLKRQVHSENEYRANSMFAPSQWETALLYNAVSHWLGTHLESPPWEEN